jgi:hypothetical protein
MPEIPSWVDFWQMIGTGIFIVPLLQWLKRLPEPWGSTINNWAWLWAPLLNALAPIISQLVLQRWPVVDAWAWIALYAGLAYLVNQITYWLARKAGRITGRTVHTA